MDRQVSSPDAEYTKRLEALAAQLADYYTLDIVVLRKRYTTVPNPRNLAHQFRRLLRDGQRNTNQRVS